MVALENAPGPIPHRVRGKRIRRPVGHLVHELAEWLLPAHCVLCGLASGGGPLCVHCSAVLPRVGHACRQCGVPQARASDPLCGRCLRRRPPYDDTIAALWYQPPADQLVQSFKFAGDLASGRALAEELACAVERRSWALPGVLVPVPLHRRRLARRGFNQADLLARDLGRRFGVPVVRTALRRSRATAAQSGLDAAARKRNIRNAFAARPLEGRHIGLIDDVMTTGATLMECSVQLKRAGAGRVSLWVAARAPPG